jgi:hypothetical protein
MRARIRFGPSRGLSRIGTSRVIQNGLERYCAGARGLPVQIEHCIRICAQTPRHVTNGNQYSVKERDPVAREAVGFWFRQAPRNLNVGALLSEKGQAPVRPLRRCPRPDFSLEDQRGRNVRPRGVRRMVYRHMAPASVTEARNRPVF